MLQVGFWGEGWRGVLQVELVAVEGREEWMEKQTDVQIDKQRMSRPRRSESSAQVMLQVDYNTQQLLPLFS